MREDGNMYQDEHQSRLSKFLEIKREQRDTNKPSLLFLEKIRMSRVTRHILIPSIITVLFFAVGLSPVELLGCRTRGLLALLIALISGLAALAAAVMGLKGRIKKDENSVWWIATTLVLTIPVVALLILA